jgi:citronellol/citronellal dehydrogenase
MAATVDAFGGIDILVNNASAIWLRGTLDTPMKRFDLMQQVNARGSFLCAQACLPYLLQAPNPHILTLARRLRWIRNGGRRTPATPWRRWA